MTVRRAECFFCHRARPFLILNMKEKDIKKRKRQEEEWLRPVVVNCCRETWLVDEGQWVILSTTTSFCARCSVTDVCKHACVFACVCVPSIHVCAACVCSCEGQLDKNVFVGHRSMWHYQTDLISYKNMSFISSKQSILLSKPKTKCY